ncbi:TIGR02588 family protein [Devosia enhydra]|uniref:TIGR02588 family protein n=1 Tax=Devosia enhydra TaxID=665118 RepID=A0A1K2I352_9HYPH|nr:hypothetical protein [Devosia enhydra]SFZ86769.1 TIGR02588 family protein [Devosia enhydra]
MAGGTDNKATRSTDDRARRMGRRIEWVAAALSALLVLGLCSHLIHEGLMQRQGHASISLAITERTQTAAGEAVTVEAHNIGRKAAIGVEIEGTLGETTATATLDFLPAGGSKPVILVFPAPTDGLSVRVSGYTEP